MPRAMACKKSCKKVKHALPITRHSLPATCLSPKICFNLSMTLLTAAKAKNRLPALLKRAIAGEKIGIVCQNRVVTLQPARKRKLSYVESEYGITPKEMRRIAKKLSQQADEEIKSGRAKTFSNGIEAALADWD